MSFEDDNRALLLELSANIVAACIQQNQVAAGDLPALIASTYGALKSVASGESVEPKEAAPKPFLPIKKSVTPDYIICLEDGKRFKSMKGHLANLGMTPDQYRRKWGLPDDYPIVAPNYAASRSELAKKFRLGRKPRGQDEAERTSA
jgi:predicted transcriptional regulator